MLDDGCGIIKMVWNGKSAICAYNAAGEGMECATCRDGALRHCGCGCAFTLCAAKRWRSACRMPFRPMRPSGIARVFPAMARSHQFVWGGEAVVGERAVQRDTVFRVASVSKMLGAAAVLHLARAGRLDLDGDVGEILGFPIPPGNHAAAAVDPYGGALRRGV